MDVAKLIAYLRQNGNESLTDIYGVGNARGQRVPLVQVPTTAGTGSEVTPISIVTTGETTKLGVVSPIMLPDWAILDADLTVGLPPHVTAATGVDAMVHAIEAYTSKFKKNPLSDALAREALSVLSGNIRTAVHQGNDREARSSMLYGSMLAGMSFANLLSAPFRVGSNACMYACNFALPPSISSICALVGTNWGGAGPFFGFSGALTNGMNATPPMSARNTHTHTHTYRD